MYFPVVTDGPLATRIRRRPTLTPLPTEPEALLRRLYRSRGGDTPGGLASLLAASGLKGIDQAASELAWRIDSGQAILVVGDYDADGATGSALAVLGLRALGARRVSYLIPSRFDYGYGLSPQVAEAAARLGPDLILTVDNGIASVAGVRRAAELGIAVLVTDHHLPGAELPEAVAIVNPNQPGCAFPSKHLAGVGVVLYLLMALRAHLREAGRLPAGGEPALAELLDLVALGTVADVVSLDANNRVLVDQGLRRIRAGRCRPGIKALLAVAGRDPARVTARDLGFFAGPRLNAAGRLEDMSLGVECLLTDDPEEAMALARRLDALNRERRRIEDDMRGEAEAMLDEVVLDGVGLPAGLCLYAPGWHQGVIGILAARIRERVHRPVIAFAPGGDGGLKGSARSIAGLHVRDAIAAVDHQNPGLVGRFGGHAMAAGLSLAEGAFGDFRDAFAEEVRRVLGDLPPVRELLSDGELPPAAMTLATAETLCHAGPWGKDFPEPLFDGCFEVADARLVGERHLKLRLGNGPGGCLDAIAFNHAGGIPERGASVHVAYRLDVNEYQGLRGAQLLIEHLAMPA